MGNVVLDIPADLAARISSGELIRTGGVVRNAVTGSIVSHLKDADLSVKQVWAAAKSVGSRTSTGKVVVGAVGAAAVTVAGVALYKWATKDKAQPTVQETSVVEDNPVSVQRFTATLNGYLDAARDGRLGASNVELLLADLDAVKAESDSGMITVAFAANRWEELVGLLAAYTRQLAEANGVDPGGLAELRRRPGGDVVLELRALLEVQQRIFKDAA
ncbi:MULTISPECIES: hypothetical protein [Actinoplanes]|uniref:hypothetical protein n=1 Tax=Actinoplanes TaxID=1865 RepID=UPI0006983B9B|nr:MULTISPECIES: hypothetical protein [Actinoplanes]GLY05715.1 hypothetical protein Acsp01_60940 [Actinoplanes sp. NBRC 101535]